MIRNNRLANLYHLYHPLSKKSTKAERECRSVQVDQGAYMVGLGELRSKRGGTGGTDRASMRKHGVKPVPPPTVTGRYRVVRY